MSRSPGTGILVLLTSLSSGLVPLALADGESLDRPTALELSHVLVQTSLVTTHFDPKPEHNNHQQLIGVELHDPQRWFAGAAWFKNSFDQPTWYFYGGREIPLWQLDHGVEVRAKLTAGLLRGYDGDKRDNIPLNHFGIAPAILPSLGLRWKRLETDIMVFGAAGMMVNGALRF